MSPIFHLDFKNCFTFATIMPKLDNLKIRLKLQNWLRMIKTIFEQD